ncbi:MAG TPA: ABC transporter permease [Acidobacteriaceae bacterium]
MLSDLKFALRQLRKSPGFMLTAVLTLVMGIGGVTAVFSVVDAVLLRPLPYPDADRLIVLHEGIEHVFAESGLSAPDVITFARESRAFTGVGGFIGTEFETTGAGAPFRAAAERMTAATFPVLGVQPVLGRTFTQAEDDNSAPVTVISYALWQERFGGAADVVGKTIDLDRRPFTIIGVMPEGFESPVGIGNVGLQDLFVPMSFTPTEKGAEADDMDYGAVARIRPGLTLGQADDDAHRVMSIIQKQVPDVHFLITLRGLKEQAVRDARPLLRTLLAAVCLILLIACANLANLLLVRAAGRRREFGVRLALGAARKAMLRQSLVESLTLSVVGGTLGLGLAAALVRTAPTALAKVSDLPRVNEIAIHWPVALLAIFLTVTTGVICGLAPALASMKADVLESLREGSKGGGQGRSQHRLRNVLAVMEAALAMLLLVACGLLLRSFARMLETNPGFQPQHVMTAYLSLPQQTYATQDKVDAFYQNLGERVQAMPGVRAVGFSSNIPVIGRNSSRLVAPEGYVRLKGEKWLMTSNYVTAGDYFGALRIPLLRGRVFNASDDRQDGPLSVVVSQSFAKQYFAGKDPVGMHIRCGPSYDDGMPAMTVVGVVGDIKPDPFDREQVPQMYEPVSQAARDLGKYAAMIGVVGSMRAVVRTTGAPRALEAAFTRAVHAADPLLAVTNVQTMDEVVTSTEASRRFNTGVLSAFAGVALALALLGIYGVLAYSVSERTREIAIRMALGATRADVQGRTLRQALLLAAIGVAAGLLAAIGLTRYLASLLYGVQPLDGVAIAGAVVLLLACAGVAGWIPARRAAMVEPMEALRTE